MEVLNKEQILAELEILDSLEKLEEFYKKYLWKKGLIAQQFKQFWKLSPEERKQRGKFLSELKDTLENLYKKKYKELRQNQINEKLNKEWLDVFSPSFDVKLWNHTLITRERRRLEEIFHSMGFHIEYGHDIVSKYENFYSLNIPKDHPATEMQDTFYLKEVANWENLILRSHTSSMQNALIKKYWLPLKVIVPWKVYRFERTDASHDTVFWQLEGLVIDKWINLANFKFLIKKILSAILGDDISMRMRPAYFPFVEPGVEIDVSCPICKWKWCSLCKKTWWIEILGAWMIHPNVLKQAGIDLNKGYKGFAFGIGLTRLVAIKYWIKDIRYFNSWDLRFIRSF